MDNVGFIHLNNNKNASQRDHIKAVASIGVITSDVII